MTVLGVLLYFMEFSITIFSKHFNKSSISNDGLRLILTSFIEHR